MIGGIAILILKLKNWYVLHHLSANSTSVQNINQDQDNAEGGVVACIPKSFNIVKRNPVMVNSKGMTNKKMNILKEIFCKFLCIAGVIILAIAFCIIASGYTFLDLKLFANYLLYYIFYIITSIILPGIYFLRHTRNIKEAFNELWQSVF